MIDNDVHYLRSILRMLREVQVYVASRTKGEPSLGGEILADNIDWLDCYIDRLERQKQ
jgi:hypothetical protein